MKKILLFCVIISILAIFLVGCPLQQSGVDIKLKQIIPITPTTRIEISKDINFNEVETETPRDYVLANSQFKIPVEVHNYHDEDFEDVYVILKKNSPIMNNLYLYSYSGKPFQRPREGLFRLDNKMIARQHNDFLLMGEVGDMPLNFTTATIDFTLELYKSYKDDQLIAINQSMHRFQLKICKNEYCTSSEIE